LTYAYCLTKNTEIEQEINYWADVFVIC